jgi:hypothetical protein
MQRANGVDAIYWNPANLANYNTKSEITILPISFKAYNNAFSIDLYNDLMVDYLTQDLKDQLLNEMNGNLNINLEFNTILFAYASNNFGLSFGTLFNTYAKIDEQYLELILNGNEYERDYMFTKKDNDVSLLAIQDITLAFGGYSLNYLLPSSMDYLPKTKYGFSFSFLSGATGQMDEFRGLFRAGDGGMNLDQNTTLHYGGGFGYKAMFGISSELIDAKPYNLSVGMTIDNILGTMKNSISCEAHEFSILAEDVYVAHLDRDFFTEQDTSYTINSFSTELPMKYALGFLLKAGNLSGSLDFAKYSKPSAFGSDLLDTSIGIEYELLDMFPLQAGYMLANDAHPSITAFGFGLRMKYWDGSIGFQLYDSVGQSSKGTAISAQMKFRF